MEKFRFILKNFDGRGNDHICEYLPENIQQLKLTRSKSAIVPIGWSIEASADTIRLIREEAEIIRRKFLRNGINAVQAVELQYLNEQATGYDTVFIQKFYPERTEVWGDFVEFGLFLNERQKWWEDKADADLSIDKTNNMVSFPEMGLYNTVSGSFAPLPLGGTFVPFMGFIGVNNNSKIFSENATAFPGSFFVDFNGINVRVNPAITLRLGANQTVNLNGSVRFHGAINQSFPPNFRFGIDNLCVFRNGVRIDIQRFFTEFQVRTNDLYEFDFSVDTSIWTTSQNDVFDIHIISQATISSNFEFDMSFGFFIEDSRTPEFTSSYIPIRTVFDKMFGRGNYNYVQRGLNESVIRYGILSGDMICGLDGAKATIKPRQFMKDWCKIEGYSFYFDQNDIAQIIPIENRFQMGGGNVLRFSENVKDVQFRYSQDLIFAGVEVGYNSPSINYPLFRQQFTEKLTYVPNQRGGSDMFNLVVDDLRVDYAGLLLQYFDFVNQPQRGDNLQQYKDVWLVRIDISNPNNHVPERVFQTNLLGGGEFNVWFSPRRILQRYLRYFGTIFGAWSNSPRLELQAEENISNNMHAFVVPGIMDFREKQEIVPLTGFDYTPMEIRFTTLANFRDVSLLQDIIVEHNGREYPAIVCNVTTTERLEEVEITAYLKHRMA